MCSPDSKRRQLLKLKAQAVLRYYTSLRLLGGKRSWLLADDREQSYPIETEVSLAQYANKQITGTGILDHHTNTAQSTSRQLAEIVSSARFAVLLSNMATLTRKTQSGKTRGIHTIISVVSKRTTPRA